jgi:hypothetical protein
MKNEKLIEIVQKILDGEERVIYAAKGSRCIAFYSIERDELVLIVSAPITKETRYNAGALLRDFWTAMKKHGDISKIQCAIRLLAH